MNEHFPPAVKENRQASNLYHSQLVPLSGTFELLLLKTTTNHTDQSSAFDYKAPVRNCTGAATFVNSLFELLLLLFQVN